MCLKHIDIYMHRACRCFAFDERLEACSSVLGIFFVSNQFAKQLAKQRIVSALSKIDGSEDGANLF